ncbi:MAG: hypothetical protein COA78_32790 [Blastopirellula sp.]|nr:MAG: hypothetical protein COA78_32790 [Blastopirellula sp.]
MAYISEIRLTGKGKTDASIRFQPGTNVVSGDSDTGKSYLLRCVDYVFGAEEMTKVFAEAAGYEIVWLELVNAEQETLTLARHLTGGDIRAYGVPIEDVLVKPEDDIAVGETNGDGADDISNANVEVLAWKRQGRSKARDITSRVFPFFGIPEEVRLRSNDKGKTQRLSIRTLLPIFVFDEAMIISERSSILGDGFGQTANKRMFSYVLTGTDDSKIIAQENQEIVRAEITAKLSLIDDLLAPVEGRLAQIGSEEDESDNTEKVEAAIESLSSFLSENEEQRNRLRDERREQLSLQRRAESQIIGIEELLERYRLLNERYTSDLQRLDFIAEGSHFFDGLQDSVCPLCGQDIDASSHTHDGVEAAPDANAVYQSAKAEAAKIQGLQRDLQAAMKDLNNRKILREDESAKAAIEVSRIDRVLDGMLAPTRVRAKSSLDELVQRRLTLQTWQYDREEAARLRNLKGELDEKLPSAGQKQTWAPIDSVAVNSLCRDIEAVLQEWSWPPEVRVEFDDKTYDIKVNGKARKSYGKGFRAVLNSALAIGLLKYCHANKKPHPKFVILDSPLTTVKQRNVASSPEDAKADAEINQTIEPLFWDSLSKISDEVQIIVLDNKEPEGDAAKLLNLQIFSGPTAAPDERAGFFPPTK